MRNVVLVMMGILCLKMYIISKPIEKELSNKLSSIRSHVKNIDYGGCSYLVVYVSDYLNKRGIDNQIILFGEETKPRHLMVLSNRTYVDSKGFFNESAVNLYFHMCEESRKTITSNELRILLNKNIWNTSFNKKDTQIIKNSLDE